MKLYFIPVGRLPLPGLGLVACCMAGQWMEFVLSSADCTELVLGAKGFGF